MFRSEARANGGPAVFAGNQLVGDHLAERLRREVRKATDLASGSANGNEHTRRRLTRLLALSGFAGVGRRNALSLRVEHHRLPIAGLAPALSGVRILQISDPHWPEHQDAAFEDALLTLVDATPHDLCVLTGDYRDLGFGPFDGALAALFRLRASVKTRMLAVFGNHDSILMAEPMRDMGIEVLVNQHTTFATADFPGSVLAVSGIDDPAYYGLHDIDAALAGIPASTPTLLLAHSPSVADEVSRRSVDACLCGHTHGGQIALPGGLAIVRHRGIPWDTLSGRWTRRGLAGYTSRGCGTSMLDARFFCPPEITLHELVEAEGLAAT